MSAKDRGRRARLRPAVANRQKPNARDAHHLLFQRLHWIKPWAKRLREHPYMRAKIPKDTLHKSIHAKVHDVPMPHEDVCEATWKELERLRQEGEIDVAHDTIEQRLDFLICFWSNYSGMEATLAIIKWQRQIVRKFYYGGS